MRLVHCRTCWQMTPVLAKRCRQCGRMDPGRRIREIGALGTIAVGIALLVWAAFAYL